MEKLGLFKDLNDGTLKGVYKIDKGILETTLITNKKGIDVYCIPTHTYCTLGCKMCHLTNEKSTKQMYPINSEEIIQSIKEMKYTNNEKVWISVMGVGDPLLNKNLIEELYFKSNFLNYKKITFAISTMMPNKSLESLTEFAFNKSMPLKVHYSMHSPFDSERLNLLPKTKVTNREALYLLKNHQSIIMNNKKIRENFEIFHSQPSASEIHYTLIENQNDSEIHLKEVSKLIKEFQIDFKIITLNPIGKLKRSKKENFWIQELKKENPNLKIRLYDPPGHQVGSSCGEFTKHYYLSELETDEEKKEFEEWKLKHQIE